MKQKPRRAHAGRPYFKAALQSDGTLELLVYEEIGESFFGDGGVTAKAVKQQIDQADSYDRMSIRINSPGGDASEGIAIYNLIRAQKKPVDVFVDGIAASAASIIAMAGDEIIMGPNSLLMVHNATGVCMGDGADMAKMAGVLNTVSAAIGRTYSVRTGKPADEIAALMDAETWFSAEEAVEQGFATAITEEAGEIEESALALARSFKALGRMKHLPEVLKPCARNSVDQCECACQNCQAGHCSDCDNAECDDPGCEDCPMQAEAQAHLAEWRGRLGIAPVSIETARAQLEDIDDRSADAVSLDDAAGELAAIEGVLYAPEDRGPKPELQRRYATALGRRLA
jgi:ATP-dependent protease ClpP protease subunit